jgi:hypothetical protein
MTSHLSEHTHRPQHRAPDRYARPASHISFLVRRESVHSFRAGTVLLAALCFGGLLLSASLDGCVVVRTLTGADVDLEQLAKAREAAMLEKRWLASAQLAQRLASRTPVDRGDILCVLSEEAVNKAARQLEGTAGWIDPSTSYTIKGVSVTLYNGCALASLSLDALHTGYNVRVDLRMDCLLSLGFEKGELYADLTPFQVSPAVTTGSMLSSVSDIIRDLLEIKLSNLKKEFPPFRFPVDFAKVIALPGGTFPVRDKLTMNIQTPPRELQYTLTLTEILIFERKALLSFSIPKVQVK